MEIEHILKAKEDAQRFIESVQELLEDRAKSDFKSEVPYGRYAASVRRKSMDLTRALSKMRNGDKYD